jgi:hypothetical protein
MSHASPGLIALCMIAVNPDVRRDGRARMFGVGGGDSWPSRVASDCLVSAGG